MRTAIKVLVLALLVQTAVVACKKDNSPTNTSLTGKWKIVRSGSSIGGPIIWKNATKTDYFIFKEDSAFESTLTTNYNRYTLKDSTILTLTGQPGTTPADYYYAIKGKSLTMGNLACIEGCPIILVKVD